VYKYYCTYTVSGSLRKLIWLPKTAHSRSEQETQTFGQTKVKNTQRVTRARTTGVQCKLTKGRALEVKLAMGI